MSSNLQKILRVAALTLAFLSRNAAAETIAIRDSEIEYLVRKAAAPLILESQMDPELISILLIDDSRLNAFVHYGTVGVFTGLIEKGSPEMLVGILAHEIGHLAYGDLMYHGEYAASTARKYAAILMALSGLSIATSRGDIGITGSLLTRHVIEREYLGFRREEEAAADSYALDILERSGLTSRGLIEFFSLYSKENPEINDLNPYLMTHDLPRTRLEKLEEDARKSPYYKSPIPREIEFAFYMSRAKVIGSFYELDDANAFYRRGNEGQYSSKEKKYFQAVLSNRLGNNSKSLKIIDDLIEEKSSYPFFYVTKASILQEMGESGAAIEEMKRAINLTQDRGKRHLELQLAKLLIQTSEQDKVKEAIFFLVKFTHKEPDNVEALTLLSIGYGTVGEIGKSHLANGRKFLALGNRDIAEEQLEMAMEALPEDSPSWIRARELMESMTE